MMRFWIDSEFNDIGGLTLISLAAVAEDGREFYAVSNEFDPARVKPWVAENVLPLLEPNDSPVWMPLSAMRDRFLAFVGDDQAEFWSQFPTYDWYLLTQLLFGGLDGLPENWPFECWDLRQWAFHLGVSELPPHEHRVHHALEDARYHRRLYEWLAQVESAR